MMAPSSGMRNGGDYPHYQRPPRMMQMRQGEDMATGKGMMGMRKDGPMRMTSGAPRMGGGMMRDRRQSREGEKPTGAMMRGANGGMVEPSERMNSARSSSRRNRPRSEKAIMDETSMRSASEKRAPRVRREHEKSDIVFIR